MKKTAKKPATKTTKPKKAAALHPAEQYLDDVLNGRVLVCKWVRLAVERHVKDLAEGEARGLRFNREAAERAIKFFGFLKHSKGEWAGHSFVLEPWQQFILWCVFGWQTRHEQFRHAENGRNAGRSEQVRWVRRFKKVHEEIARKNGKSTKLAGVGLYLLVFDGEQGAEVYSAATKKDQARIVHDEAEKMVKASPDLKGFVSTFRDNLSCESTNSKFEPLGADDDTLDGLNISGAIIDELHAHKTRKVYDILDTATGARAQPLIWAITTAGIDGPGLYNDEHEYAKKVLEGIIEDDSIFAIIFTLDDGDDWRDEKVWIKANPNLGVSVSLDDLRRKCARAIEITTTQNDFIRLHMNRRTQQIMRWLDMVKWDACGEPFDESYLEGRPCYGGLDLASKLDLAAWVMVFPPTEDDPVWYVLVRCFVPRARALEREKRDRVPYVTWEREGYLTMTEGDVIDYEFIKAQVMRDSEIFQIHSIGFDSWNASQIALQLTNLGATMLAFGQGYRSMSEPTKELEVKIVAKNFNHGGHPVARWCASNVMTESDPAGNIKPSKAKSTERIDIIVAIVMALGLAITKQGENGESVYETQGLNG